MDPRPQPGERFRSRTLHRWYALTWVLLGACPPVIGALDELDTSKYWLFGLLAVICLSYLLVGAFPANPILRPRTFLGVLVVGLAVVAYLLEGGASLFIMSLPLFWIFATGPRQAIGFSGAAAATSIIGGTAPQGWSPNFLTGNVIAILIGYAASVLLGLWMDKVLGQSDERARRLNTELEHAQHQLAQAHQRQGAADERERLAREIHDTLAQGFASIVVLAEAARSDLDTDPARSTQQLLSIENTARENLAEARALVSSAPAGGIPAGSVAQTLRRTLDRFSEDTGLTVNADLRDVDCDQPTRIALLRCTQESLANVRKHAAASTVGIVLSEHPFGIELEITDDGRGFVVEESHGFGLNGMRKRLAELGGELTVTSSVGDGTRVLAMIPSNGQV
ncbi:sensor histidine kinase [Actinopolymorpha pittospori]|uniref:histidine kinase n=1 Tax=Actinopolymorpha pittospori TaxID=648752 RepID=A0A927R7J5_9ACTN|nr:sensor histidine kinase [Actinopolymorpha pittospori]MBE1604309.1 signal transduction histidine kinase [Actinopolymorpha pittospori]